MTSASKSTLSNAHLVTQSSLCIALPTKEEMSLIKSSLEYEQSSARLVTIG